jgi:hypothetical protein
VLVVLWTVGLLSGAIHPLGYLAALAWLAVSTWFLVALGTALSLRARDAKHATGRVVTPVSLLVFSALLLLVFPPAGRSVLLAVGSVPFLADLSLVSYEEVRVMLHTGSFPRLDAMRLGTGDGAARVLATCLISLTGQAIAAFLLARSAFRGFDALVGRPVRPDGSPDADGRGSSPPVRFAPEDR